MTVDISVLGGAAAQFFDGSGNPLTGGKIYTYAAGTTTPQTTYTTNLGTIAHDNPIILDSAGRVPNGGEIWLITSAKYKFVISDSNDVVIGTYDNIEGNGGEILSLLSAPTGASLIGFTGFNGQIGTVADLADGDGSDWIGYQPTGTGAVALSVQDKLRQTISVFDFMTEAEIAAALSSSNTYDNTLAIQAFFNEIQTNQYAQAILAGNLRVSAKITLISPKINQLVCNCTITCIAAFPSEVLRFQSFVGAITGKLYLQCVGSTTWSGRGNYHGIIFDNCQYLTVDYLFVLYAMWNGVDAINSTFLHIKQLATAYCGSAGGIGAIGTSTAYSSFTNTDSSGSTSQTSIINVSSIPDGLTIGECWARIGSDLYYIRAIDRVANTVTVYPWVDATLPSGTLYYIGGCGFVVNGDCQMVRIDAHQPTGCGIGMFGKILYPPIVGAFTSQACGVAYMLAAESNGSVGGSIQHGYFESNTFDFVQGTTATCSFVMSNNTALSLTKCRKIAPRLISNAFSPSFTYFRGIRFANGSLNLLPNNVTQTAPVITSSTDIVLYPSFDPNIIRLYLQTGIVYICYTTGAVGGVPTSVTFNAPSGGTINGGATAVFNAFTAPPVFAVATSSDGLTLTVVKVSG